MHDKETIDINEIGVDINEYDHIIIGTPVWWYTLTPPIRTFLNKYNLNDKKVDIFITNGGWIGHTITEFREHLNVNSYINIVFNGHNLKTDVTDWINNLK